MTETMKVSFELSADDIAYFRARLKRAHERSGERDDAKIIKGAKKQVEEALADESPEFVRLRLEKLGELIAMVEDDDWRLEGRDRIRVMDALAYFDEPEDIIHDHVPGIGYLDDAIMVELVERELRHELKAYEDFCEFRGGHKEADPKKIESRREKLQGRMRRRRRHELDKIESGNKRSPFRLW